MTRYNKMITNNPLMVTIKFARYKFVAKLLQKEDSVLEVGCFDGVSSNFFSQFCKEIDAFDIDAGALAEAKESFPHVNFLEANALEFRTDKKYDAVIMLDFIEHFSLEDGEKLLAYYSTILSDRGMLIIGTPSRHFEKYRAEHNRAHHLHEYYPDELEGAMKQHFERTMMFAMNDEIVHTGNIDLAWFVYCIGTYPKK